MRWPLTATLALAALALPFHAPLRAQAPVDTGLTRAQVIERLGPPAAERTAAGLTLLFYESACAPTCTTDDVVVLQGDRVVETLFQEIPRAYVQDTTSFEGYAPLADLGGTTPRAVEPLSYHLDPTLHAARPLVARPYRLPGSFAPGEVEAFDRLRGAGQ
jgi:hypothetical protein